MNLNMTEGDPKAMLHVAAPLLMLFGLGLTSFGEPAGAPPGRGDSQITGELQAEVARLRQQIGAPPLADGINAQERARMETLLTACEEALDRGPGLADVRRVARARLEIERARYQVDFQGVQDQATLERLSAEALEQTREGAAGHSKGSRPAYVQALIEVADGRARRYIASAPAQGDATRLATGIYYLSIGRAYASLAGFVSSLPCTAPPNPVQDLPGLAGYMDRLDAQLVELYKPPISITRHSEFIATSATLKLARQLYEEGAILGALELALETHTGLARFHERGEVAAEGLQASLTQHKQAIAAAAIDHSLGSLLVGRAEGSLGEQPDGNEPDALGDAAILLKDVLPEYFASFTDGRRPEATPAEVTVTLVRWPFT